MYSYAEEPGIVGSQDRETENKTSIKRFSTMNLGQCSVTFASMQNWLSIIQLHLYVESILIRGSQPASHAAN